MSVHRLLGTPLAYIMVKAASCVHHVSAPTHHFVEAGMFFENPIICSSRHCCGGYYCYRYCYQNPSAGLPSLAMGFSLSFPFI